MVTLHSTTSPAYCPPSWHDPSVASPGRQAADALAPRCLGRMRQCIDRVVSRPYGGCTHPLIAWVLDVFEASTTQACNRRLHRQMMGSPCDAGSRCAHWPDTILGGDDLTRDVRHRTRDETVAITYGVQTPAIAVVRMNVFRVPTGRAVDPGGTFVAGGLERFDSRSHEASVSQLGYRSIR
jgi:hypothetical protein